MGFHVFRVPPSEGTTNYHSVHIMLDPLTPNFYPKIFLNKVERSSEPSTLSQLKYPSLVSHDLAFGENPFYQLQSTKFDYKFTGSATEKQVFYTMAIYQHTWGLTSYRKSEYQIR